jgi:hypothetical protein
MDFEHQNQNKSFPSAQAAQLIYVSSVSYQYRKKKMELILTGSLTQKTI